MSVCTMKKLTVLAYDRDADAIVRKLMSLRCVEIRNTETRHGLLPVDLAANEAQRQRTEQRLTAIRRVIPILAKYTRRRHGIGRVVHRVDRHEFITDGRGENAWQTVEDTQKAQAHIDALTAEITEREAYLASLEPWLEYDAPLNVTGSTHTTLILGSTTGNVQIANFREELETAGAYAEEIQFDEQLYLAVTCHKDDDAAVDKVLSTNGFLRITFPDTDVPARVAYERTEERLQELENEMIRAEEDLRDLSDALDDIEILCDIEATTLAVCMQKRKLAATKSCVVLQGWIPAQAEEAVVDALSKFECACETSEPEADEEPPVLLRNNRFAINFEWVIGMYSYPKYGAFDPTFIMSLFYFVIFGLMFADVGYGLLLIACCFGGIKLLNPRTGMRRMLSMFGYCGISCVIMGVIFGGWFGDLPIAIMTNLLHLPVDTGVGHFFSSGLWFNPLDDPMTFLIFSLVVGAIHMITGMAINFYVLCKQGRAAEALCTILPYWVLFGGLALLLVNMMLGGIVSAVGALLILVLNGYGQKSIFSRIVKGLGGLYGLISYASDLLSYSRILALGLVAGVIAKVINLITMMGDGNPIGFVVMLLVLIVGHLLNIAINLLGTFIHASRLQYLEFFGKFFEDGGVPFDPALPAQEYSEEISD